MNRSFLPRILLMAAAASAFAQSIEPAFPKSGIASWYGPEFEGKATASGELFDSSLLTAAHPTLPFGTELRVTNAHNGRKVDVRVNDRGPFVAARIIDLSRAAAEKLDMIITGTAPVSLEIVGEPSSAPGSSGQAAPAQAADHEPAAVPEPLVMAAYPAQAAAASEPAVPETAAAVAAPAPAESGMRKSAALKPRPTDAANGKRYRLQVGSYKLVRNATEAFNRLKQAGLEPSYERFGDLYRVVLVGVGAAELDSYAERLGGAGFAEALVREEH